MDMTDDESLAALGRASVHFHVYLADPRTGAEVGRAQVSAGETFANMIDWVAGDRSGNSTRGIANLVVGMQKLASALKKARLAPMDKHAIDVHGRPKELTKAQAEKIVLALWKKHGLANGSGDAQ